MNEQPKYTNACLEAEQLVAWFDGALPPETAHTVQMHLETCAYCTRHFKELVEERQQVFGLLAQLDPPPTRRITPATVAALARFQEHVSQSGNDNMSLESTPFTQLRRERPRFHRVAIQALVAALILAVLTGTILSLMQPRVVSPGSPLSSGRDHPTPSAFPTVTVRTEAGGLSMSMQLTAGPYFLNEMLQVDLSLSNHSTTTYTLLEGGIDPGRKDPCVPLLDVVMQGGVPPSDTTLEQNLSKVFCIGLHGRFNNGSTLLLHPGNTYTARQYVVLTHSGHIQLTAQAWFVRMGIERNAKVWVPVSTPLTEHWPTIQLDVSTHVPAQRTLLLRQQTTPIGVTVVVPPGTHPQLLFLWLLTCSSPDQSRGIVSSWFPLPAGTPTVRPILPTATQMLCDVSSPVNSWTYIIGAPGLATQSGSYRPKT